MIEFGLWMSIPNILIGERDDWTDLCVYGALLAVGTGLFNRKGVHYLSGFYGPLERALKTLKLEHFWTPYNADGKPQA